MLVTPCIWIGLMALLLPFLIAEKVVRQHRKGDE